MSKYSIKENRAKKLEDSLLGSLKQATEQKDDLSREEIAALDASHFGFADYDASAAEKTGYSNYSYWGATVRMFFKNKLAVAMLLVLFLLLAFTFIQPYLPAQFDPKLNDMSNVNQAPNSVHWFGTNNIGQDLWANIWSGTATSLFIGFTVALVEAVVGILIGMLWGYVRKLDFFFTELYNVLNNIPTTIILVLAAYIMKPSVATIIIAMSVTTWIGLARFIRNQVLMIRDRDFNLASRCLGTPTGRIITKNLLPQMVSVIMLRMALAVPGAIGSEVFLTYIGLGLPIDTPSLGNLVNKGRQLMMVPQLRYQLAVPAIVLSIITICFYLVGNAFADAADPRNHV